MCNKKVIALLISVVMIFSTFTFNASAQELNAFSITLAEYEAYKSNPPAKFSFRSVKAPAVDNTELRNYLFDAIYNNQIDFADYVNGVYYEGIDVEKFNLNMADDLLSIEELIFNCMPEIFGNVRVISPLYDNTGFIYYLSFEYALEINEFQSMYNEFLPVVKEMTKGLHSNRISDVKKALILHDRLAIKCEYDLELAAAEEEKDNEENEDVVPAWDAGFTAYGALVEGSAVCQGYTEAYEYLLEQVGIKSEQCSSNLLNHVWNIVYINGIAYHVDVTWDDPVFEDKDGNPISKPAEYIEHNNFLLSSEALFSNGHNKDNHFDYNFTPNNTTFDDYFWKGYHSESFIIGNDVYYFDNDGSLCGFDEQKPLIEAGLADINTDRKIDSLDVSLCRQYLTQSLTPDSEQTKACDLTKNDSIDITDLVHFKKILLYLG